MNLIWTIFALLVAVIWVSILMLPWNPWRTREFLDADSPLPEEDLSNITALIPARNEAEMLKTTLPALRAQGRGLKIIVIDDQSTDTTTETARRAAGEKILVVSGKPVPPGWSGKLWALQQGLIHVKTPLTLLLDADIETLPGILGRMRIAMKKKNVQMISLMASLRMETFWEKLLMPAFIFFFKLLYPFRLSNNPLSGVAAAAGGCILLETKPLAQIGGFKALRGELIDDCALARRIKARGNKTWIGLTHSVRSIRPYNDLGTIWNMVARTAFTQLRYSGYLLALCTVVMALSFLMPMLGPMIPGVIARLLCVIGLIVMILVYLPTLKFYGRSSWWALIMPLIGTLYLAMTWTSAVRYWQGKGAQWKGRTYTK